MDAWASSLEEQTMSDPSLPIIISVKARAAVNVDLPFLRLMSRMTRLNLRLLVDRRRNP